jgi:hypothetical protein
MELGLNWIFLVAILNTTYGKQEMLSVGVDMSESKEGFV